MCWFHIMSSDGMFEAHQNKEFARTFSYKFSFISSISRTQMTVNLQLQGLHLLKRGQQLKGKEIMMVCMISVYLNSTLPDLNPTYIYRSESLLQICFIVSYFGS